jgi:hypothetical protein
MLVGSTTLDFLPQPRQALEATMPFDPNMGVGKHPSLLRRTLLALPLLFFFYLCTQTLRPTVAIVLPIAAESARVGMFPVGDRSPIPINNSTYGIAGLDNMIKLFTAVFMPFTAWLEKVATLQAVTFLADIVPLHVIWVIESMIAPNASSLNTYSSITGLRRGNFLTFAKL